MEMSFWQLIDKYRIEIPVLQRDYAQGRQNAKAEDVRRNIISKIKGAVCLNAGNSKDVGKNNLSFDFVYGRIEADKFIPFDGQQRLTTLFLLHKYVVNRCGNKDEHLKKLKKFSYATRRSSREFCEKFVAENVIPSDDTKISQFIVDQPWYYLEWGRDPTISGMLTMLDEIHGQLKSENNFSDIFKQLTSQDECPIRFHFVDMGANKLKDDIYIKMNARGKVLTPFENFKASLEMYLEFESNKTGNAQNIATAELARMREPTEGIDGKWLDMFWHIANPKLEVNEKTLPDPLMLSFVNRHFINLYHANIKKFIGTDMVNIDGSLKSYPENDRFVSWDLYEMILNQCSIKKAITPIFNIWGELSSEKVARKIKASCNAIWSRSYIESVNGDEADSGDNAEMWDVFSGEKANDEHFEAYPSRVTFYALMLFFEEGVEYNDDALSAWMRVVWNIVENSTIDSKDTYRSALSLVVKLSVGCHNIYSALAGGEKQLKLGQQYHAKDQVLEEIEKARQILDDNGELRVYSGTRKEFVGKTWKEVIEIAEASAFFKGAIRFLYRDGSGNVDWELFDNKWRAVLKYFDKDGVRQEYRIGLTKALVNACDRWNDELYDKQIFNPNSSTWKWILCAKNWRKQIHALLTSTTLSDAMKSNKFDDDNVTAFVKPILADLPYEYIVDSDPNGRIRWNGRLAFYRPYGRDAITLDWRDFNRNAILSSLLQGNFIDVEKENKLAGNNRLFLGWNVNFTYKGYRFQWLGMPNYGHEVDVYLMMSCKWDYQRRLGLDKKQNKDKRDVVNFYCFDARQIECGEEFRKSLEKLIDEFEMELQEQSCTNSK